MTRTLTSNHPRPVDVLPSLAQAPVFYLLLDADGKVSWANRYPYRLTPQGVIGTPAADAVDPEDRPTFLHAWSRSQSLREVVHGEVRTLSPIEGLPMRHAFRLGPRVEGHDVTGGVLIVWDVTHEKSNCGWPGTPFLLSPLEKRVARLLMDKGHAKGVAIAAWVNQRTPRGDAKPKLQFLLGQLVDRRVLLQSPDGYSINPAFRPLVDAACRSE